jgi:hypothetical protein
MDVLFINHDASEPDSRQSSNSRGTTADITRDIRRDIDKDVKRALTPHEDSQAAETLSLYLKSGKIPADVRNLVSRAVVSVPASANADCPLKGVDEC